MIDFKANPFFLSDSDITWVQNTLASMTTEEKCGQLFNVLFKDCTEEEFDYILGILSPGGCTYRVVPTETAVKATNYLQKHNRIPLLIAGDLEKGGSGIVEEGTLLGTPMEVAATGEVEMARKLGVVCAREAQAVGANWAFAPVIDIDTNCFNPITNIRTFGSDPETVREMGKAFVEGAQANGIATALKHFPGDGQDFRDQHIVTSINTLGAEEWMETYGKAYQASIDAGALTCMVSHIMLPSWSKKLNPALKDEEILPASLSKELLMGLLRGVLGFNGLITTDSTTMAGYLLAMSRKDAVPYSIAAGADMFLFSRNQEEDYGFMLEGIRKGVITKERLDEAVSRILATKAALGLHKKSLQVSEEKAKCIVGNEEHKAWSYECADKGITLVKEEKNVLPLSKDKYKKILLYVLDLKENVENGKASGYRIQKMLEAEGFQVDQFIPKPYGAGFTERFMDYVNNYDLVLYVASYPTKSYQTVVRASWGEPLAALCGHYLFDIPTVFVSTENPYHLLDFPRVKTFINCYSSSEGTLKALVDKLMGRTSFKGKSPSDPFCGLWDARL